MPTAVPFLALAVANAFTTAPDLTPAATAAAPSAKDDEPGDVVVTGERARRPADPKAVAPLVDTPRSVVVLPAEVIAQTGSNSLQDALRTVPGITFGAAEGGNPIGDRPFIRGFDSQGSIYVDGVRDLGSQTREVFSVEEVQVVRGSDSTLGGRGSAGGTLNIVSRLPRAGTFGSVSASGGEADYKRVTGDVNVQVAPAAAFRLQGLWHDQDVAGRDAIHQRRWGVAPSLTIGLGQATRLTASYYHLESHELPDSGIPYLYTIGNAPGTGTVYSEPALGRVTTAGGQTGTVARSAFYGLTDRDFRDATTHQAMLRVEHDLGGRLTLRNTARFTRADQAYIYTQPDDSQGNAYASGQVWRRPNTRYGHTESIIDQTDLYGTFRTGGVEHSIALGTEFAWEKARRGVFVTRGYLGAGTTEILSGGSTVTPRCTAAAAARFNCTSLFSPNPGDPWVNYATDTSTAPSPIVKSLPNEETQNDGATQAVYAFDSITLLPQLILNLGARYDRFTSVLRPGQAYAATTQVRLERTDSLFNWQAGLVLKPTRETSVYANYATSATPPNTLLGEGREDNAVPTTNTGAANLQILSALEPQKTKSYEVGAKASLAHERLQLQVAAFQTTIDNARVQIDPNTVAFIGRSRVRGIELTANGTILPGWTVFGGYTYLDPVIVDGGNTVLTAAAVTGAGGVVLRPAATVAVPSVNTGKQLPNTFRHSFTATTNVELVKGVQIGGSAIYNSRQFGGYADNRAYVQTAATGPTLTPATKVLYRTVPGYWRFDLRASYAVTRNVELSVNAQNVLNRTYFNQAYASHYASIAPGRTVFGTVGVKF